MLLQPPATTPPNHTTPSLFLVSPENEMALPRLCLEPLVVAHATALYTALQDPALYTFIPQDPPLSLADLLVRYAALSMRRSPTGQEVWLNWVLRRRGTDDYVGAVQATIHEDRTTMLAYMIFPSFWGHGYAREGCARVLTHLREAYDVSRVAAEIDTRNTASIQLIEVLGFNRVALTPHADFFKGAESDEYLFELHQ